MGRYVERAENVARIVDVNLQLMFDVPQQQAQQLQKNWLSVAACLGDDEALHKAKRRADCESVVEFLIFDRENSNSIVNCLAAARENARTVREQISTEMWEQINRSHLWCMSKPARQAFERNRYDFFQRIKEISHLFQGITDASMTHGEGWDFIQLGKFLERADKTSRVLDDEYHLLRGKGAPDPRQWSAVLRSCSARQAYQKKYVAEVTPIKVAELLLLDETFPRSFEFCVYQVDHSLRRLSGAAPGRFSNRAERISGRLFADLAFSTIEDIYSRGLHQAMDGLQVQLNEIGAAVHATYIDVPLPAEPRTSLTPQVEQAQQ